jgi:hypothetical protein
MLRFPKHLAESSRSGPELPRYPSTGVRALAERRRPASAPVDRLAPALRRHQHEPARLLGLREVELARLQIVDRPRGIATTALAERLGLGRAATTAVVDGLVVTERAQRWDDRRRVRVGVTAPPGASAPWWGLTDDLAARQDGEELARRRSGRARRLR